jgi:hypothetical protein
MASLPNNQLARRMADWSKPTKIPTQNILQKKISNTDTRQLRLLEGVTLNLPTIQLHKIFAKINKHWCHVGFLCSQCDMVFSHPFVVKNHKNICERLNTIQGTEFMPIQVVMQNGTRYYRWGDSGKLYTNIKDAQAQAQAVYASGYKDPIIKPLPITKK